jgi:hypothetical protein
MSEAAARELWARGFLGVAQSGKRLQLAAAGGACGGGVGPP